MEVKYLKQRLLSALVLIILGIPIIIAGDKTFAITIGFLGILGLKELIDIKKKNTNYPALLTFMFYIGLLLMIYINPFDFDKNGINMAIICTLILWYLIPTIFLSSKYTVQDAIYFLGMTLFLGLAFHNTILIRLKSLWLFLYILLIPIITDTFAYCFGCIFGRHPLAPKVSPKKTWEGSILGTIFAIIIGSVYYYYLVEKTVIFNLIIMTLFLSIMSQLGDLFFSKIKRENAIKDFSNLIPGHGGILDRFDSLIMVVITYSILIPYL